MPVHTGVLPTLFKYLPQRRICELARECQVDRYAKVHSIVNDLKALLFFHTDEEDSLTELTYNLKTNHYLMRACGYSMPISLSQFSRDNKLTTPRFYFGILQATIEQAQNLGVYKTMRRYRKLIVGYDGMFIRLNPEVFTYAKQGYCPMEEGVRWGVKVHAAVNAGIGDTPPVTIRITTGDVHDSKMFEVLESDVLRLLPHENIIFVIDKGYTSLERYQGWLDKDRFFIIPLHENLTKKGRKVKTISPYKGTGKGDYVFRHPALKTDLRLVVVKRNGKKFRLLTNIWNYRPSTIVEIYRKRWDCEVFNKEMKQHFRIKKPIGLSWNAICIQIITAYIAYLLLLIVKALSGWGETLLQLKRYVSINWWRDEPLSAGPGPPVMEEMPVLRTNLSG